MNLDLGQLKELSRTLIQDGEGPDKGLEAEPLPDSADPFLLRNLLQVEEEDRGRIAGMIHDTVLQDLIAVKMRLEDLGSLSGGGAERPDDWEEISRSLLGLVEGLYETVFELRPPLLDELGLAATLEWLDKILSRRHPFARIKKTIELQGVEPPPLLALNVFRITRKIVSQALEDRGADSLDFRLSRDSEGLVWRLRDNGLSLTETHIPRQVKPTLGQELAWLIKRVELTGARMECRFENTPETEMIIRWSPGAIESAGPENDKRVGG